MFPRTPMEGIILIKILCKKLSGDVSNAVYNEYASRWEDIEKIWAYPQNRYQKLQSHEIAVQHLLAISTFYRRVLSGFDGARDFYATVSKSFDGNQNDIEISIGKFKLNRTQYNKLLGIQIEFDKIRKKYGLDDSFFEYNETDEFLTNCMRLYREHIYRENNSSNKSEGSPDDLPF